MDFEKIKKSVAAAAKRAGVTEYELYFQQSESVDASAFRNELQRFSSSVGCGVCLKCMAGGRMGYASTEIFEPGTADELVRRAKENALLIEKDEKAFIYEGKGNYVPVADNTCALPGSEAVTAAALKCQSSAYAANPLVSDGTQCGAFAAKNTVRIYNSYGLDLSCVTGYEAIYAEVLETLGDETNTAFEIGLGALDSIDTSRVASIAASRAAARFGSGKVKSGEYDVIFDARRARDILETFCSVFFAKTVQTGMSLLKGKKGEIIASECVTLIDDPFSSSSPVNASFDAEGVPTYKKNIIEDGVLKTFLYNLSTADTDNTQSTGNASKASYAANVSTSPYCFYIASGEYTREVLFKKAGNGIYITEMKGFHAGADAVTGDFSIESAGFLIENGKQGAPVKEFTVAGNFFEMLKTITAISDTLEYSAPSGSTQFGAPDILVPGMSIGGE
ncbi:MAG TPA: metallopeptidase TldD-related protein [Bacillota bacterium]|nr:metallopeptidase TldD-related protein [Bacillota bacterium]